MPHHLTHSQVGPMLQWRGETCTLTLGGRQEYYLENTQGIVSQLSQWHPRLAGFFAFICLRVEECSLSPQLTWQGVVFVLHVGRHHLRDAPPPWWCCYTSRGILATFKHGGGILLPFQENFIALEGTRESQRSPAFRRVSLSFTCTYRIHGTM